MKIKGLYILILTAIFCHQAAAIDILCKNILKMPFNSRFVVEKSSAIKPKIAGYGKFSSLISFLEVKSDTIKKILPPDLTLADSNIKGDNHPILVMFGHNRPTTINGVRVDNVLANLFSLGSVTPYNEMIVFIPYVKFKVSPGNETLNYSHSFYLDSLPAQIGGVPYSFPKELANLKHNPDSRFYSVMQKSKLIASAKHRDPQKEINTQNITANLKNIFELPVVNYNSKTSSYKFARFDYKDRTEPLAKVIDVYLNRSFFGSEINKSIDGMYVEFDFGLSLPY